MVYDPYGPGDHGASPFDDFLARFYGSPRRPQRIDIGKLMTEQARELVRDAAAQAAQWGDPDLDTEHLLWAATRQEPVRRLLTAGQDLQAALGLLGNHPASGKIRHAVDEMDQAIRDIRDTISITRQPGSLP